MRGDAAATAANLLAHETLFRFGMLADVAGSIFFLMLAFALYRLLSRVDRTQAAFMVETSLWAPLAGTACPYCFQPPPSAL